MHCPFTSEISVKRKHIISITVMRYFYFFMSVITCVGPPPRNAPPFTHLTALTQETSARKKEKLPKCFRCDLL